MDLGIFLKVLLASVGVVGVQGFLSWRDEYLTQSQLHRRGISPGWAFVEHGGMWADVFLVAPALAYVLANYELNFATPLSLLLLFLVAFFCLVMGCYYQRNGAMIPEAHAHDGRTTAAGWVHGVFAIAALWVLALFYLNMTTPRVSKTDLLYISLAMAAVNVIGVLKFNWQWRFDGPAVRQVAIGLIALCMGVAGQLLLWT